MSKFVDSASTQRTGRNGSAKWFFRIAVTLAFALCSVISPLGCGGKTTKTQHPGNGSGSADDAQKAEDNKKDSAKSGMIGRAQP